MKIRTLLSPAIAAALLLAGCRDAESGPVVVSAIGAPPSLVNPNRTALDPPAAMLANAVAQGLVRFDPAGQIEPALAQSWTVTDDGTSYIFRIARTKWSNGTHVTAEQVAERLRAAASRASRNRLKPLLGSIAGIVAMTDRVIEIRLRAPRPNFLQLLAQPDMAIVRAGQGTGPLAAEPGPDGALLLRPRDEEEDAPLLPDLYLRGEAAPLAVARYQARAAALVTGGTAIDLPIARAANPPDAALRFDPVAGMFGLTIGSRAALVAEPEGRRALNMAIDREAIVAALAVPNLAPRLSLLPAGIEEQPAPAQSAWAALPLPARQAEARAIIAGIAGGSDAPKVRVAMPDGPGATLLFAHLRRDWRAIGVEAERVAIRARADLRFVDEVAPAGLASWYLRHFTCDASIVCSNEVDTVLEKARNATSFAERRDALAEADRLLTEAVPFLPIAAPVRWSLVSPRMTGFQPNPFAGPVRRSPGRAAALSLSQSAPGRLSWRHAEPSQRIAAPASPRPRPRVGQAAAGGGRARSRAAVRRARGQSPGRAGFDRRADPGGRRCRDRLDGRVAGVGSAQSRHVEAAACAHGRKRRHGRRARRYSAGRRPVRLRLSLEQPQSAHPETLSRQAPSRNPGDRRGNCRTSVAAGARGNQVEPSP
jgi:peptide/nickel transport system substrate-binding protein